MRTRLLVAVVVVLTLWAVPVSAQFKIELRPYVSGAGVAAGPISFPLGTTIREDAANVLAQRNSTNAQTLRIYTSYTDGSNYEYGSLAATAGAFTISAGTLGTGTDNIDIVLTPVGAGKAIVSAPYATGSGTNRALDVTHGWNTSGVVDGSVRIAITDTASGAGSKPFAIYGGAAAATALFSVDKSGNAGFGTTAQTYRLSFGSGFSSDTSSTAFRLALFENAGGGNMYGFGMSGAGYDQVWWANGTPALTMSSTGVATFAGNIIRTGANGQKSTIAQATVVCTIATSTNCTGTGTGTIAVTNLIPAGSLVVGVTVRVTTIIAGSDGIATWELGHAGDTDAWGAGLALAANTTNSIADFTVTTPGFFTAATSVTLSGTGGKIIDSGVVRVTVHYLTVSAATS